MVRIITLQIPGKVFEIELKLLYDHLELGFLYCIPWLIRDHFLTKDLGTLILQKVKMFISLAKICVVA